MFEGFSPGEIKQFLRDWLQSRNTDLTCLLLQNPVPRFTLLLLVLPVILISCFILRAARGLDAATLSLISWVNPAAMLLAIVSDVDDDLGGTPNGCKIKQNKTTLIFEREFLSKSTCSLPKEETVSYHFEDICINTFHLFRWWWSSCPFFNIITLSLGSIHRLGPSFHVFCNLKKTMSSSVQTSQQMQRYFWLSLLGWEKRQWNLYLQANFKLTVQFLWVWPFSIRVRHRMSCNLLILRTFCMYQHRLS